MVSSAPLLAGLAAITIVLIGAILLRPSVLWNPAGRVLIFAVFLPLPILQTWVGSQEHLEMSKRTEFCLSCHAMQDYGKTLLLDESDYLPAAHFQNRRIPAGYACFTCHTSYTMYGDLEAKIRGLRHVWVNYFGTIPDELHLYEPYSNRECLHCHAGARSFEEGDLHVDEREAIENDETSCLECHDMTHPIDEVQDLAIWDGSRQLIEQHVISQPSKAGIGPGPEG